MSKISDARREPQKGQEQQVAEVKAEADEYPPPLKARRGLFVLFAALLALLFAGMLTMYFTTVYPNRHKPQSVETDRTTEPAGQR